MGCIKNLRFCKWLELKEASLSMHGKGGRHLPQILISIKFKSKIFAPLYMTLPKFPSPFATCPKFTPPPKKKANRKLKSVYNILKTRTKMFSTALNMINKIKSSLKFFGPLFETRQKFPSLGEASKILPLLRLTQSQGCDST